MTDTPWDAIIVGQGLAGTTLAWHLILAGQRVLIIDADEPVTSSKIAAGLMTPITGRQLALSWRVSELFPVAREFYRHIERRTQQRFYYPRRAVRLFSSEKERRIWPKRQQLEAYQDHLLQPQPTPLIARELLATALGNADADGFAMQAAQLDVAAYLAVSRAAFTALGSYQTMTLDWAHNVAFDDASVAVGQHRARRVISCEGYAAKHNPYFADVQFNAAKGEILTVRFDQPMPDHTLHRDLWVAATADPAVFKVGATYSWASLDHVPTAVARAEIERKLRAFLRVPYTVLDHQAAVRPIINLRKALLGLHQQHRRLGYFNGLASKGSLHAPWLARCFTEFLVAGTPLPDDLNVRNCEFGGHSSHVTRN